MSQASASQVQEFFLDIHTRLVHDCLYSCSTSGRLCEGCDLAFVQMGDQPGTAIVWFRNDLRLTDQEPLTAACASLPKALLPILCLEPASLGHRSNLDAQLNTPQLGPHLARLCRAVLLLDRPAYKSFFWALATSLVAVVEQS